MNALIRWGKFNVVGAMGMVLQLTALAVFERCARGHYLVASAAAVELAVLHNFAWHLHYTWRDRSEDLRADDSTGAVSSLEWACLHGGQSCDPQISRSGGPHANPCRGLHRDIVLFAD